MPLCEMPLQEVSAIYVHYCFYRHSISQQHVLQKIVDKALAQSADDPTLSVEHQEGRSMAHERYNNVRA